MLIINAFFSSMKKVFLIAGGEFGDNLCELLRFEGFDSEILQDPGKIAAGEIAVEPDLYICDAKYLRMNYNMMLVNYLNRFPCIVLSPDGLPPRDWPDAYQYLEMPFSDTQLFEAVNGCLGLNSRHKTAGIA